MTRAYSMDLRERAIARVEAGESARGVAATLSVSPSSVIKWAQRFRAKGSVAPDKIGGYRPKAIVGEHRLWLLQRVGSDFTLRGLVAELGERGRKVDYRTVWNFVHAERLSFKKKRSAGRIWSSAFIIGCSDGSIANFSVTIHLAMTFDRFRSGPDVQRRAI